jgi:hypothetical protein
MIDFMIWPWFERFPVLKQFKYELDPNKYPKLNHWTENMKNLRAVKEIMISPDSNTRFFKSFSEGNIDYDFEMK